jgi:hypothetical protein
MILGTLRGASCTRSGAHEDTLETRSILPIAGPVHNYWNMMSLQFRGQESTI